VPVAPPCLRLGSQCTSLKVTLRIGSLTEGAASLDHEATWLLGHTGRITFRELWEGDGDLYAEATLHVRCRYLKQEPGGQRCSAHGFFGQVKPSTARRQPRQLGNDRFRVVDRRRLVERHFPPPSPSPSAPSRTLPVVDSGNPCEGAPCKTADHTRGAACCRDLQVEIMCTPDEAWLESLVRSRLSPYLCKIEREGKFSLGAEVISACGYLEPGGVACTLHGRTRRDGRTAKPDLCFDWPPKGKGLHPGCVFTGKPGKAVRSVHK
jgi:hypothetical protein